MKQTKLNRYSPRDVEMYVVSSIRNKRDMSAIIKHAQTVVNRLGNAKFDDEKIKNYLADFLTRQSYMRYYIETGMTAQAKLEMMSRLRSEMISSFNKQTMKAKLSMLLTVENHNVMRYFYAEKARNISNRELQDLYDELFTSDVFALYNAKQHQSVVNQKRSIVDNERWISAHAEEYALEQAYLNEF